MTLSVAGGQYSVAADFDRLLDYARRMDQAALEIARSVRLLLTLLTDPAVLAAGLLDPAGGAVLLARLAADTATATMLEAGCLGLAAALRAAVRSYQGADELAGQLRPLALAGRQLPAAVSAVARPGSLDSRLQSALVADPGLADAAVRGAAVAVLGPVALTAPAMTGVAAGVLSAGYRDGRPVLLARPELPTDDDRGAPRTVTDLLTGLRLRAGFDDGGGLIDIRLLDPATPAGPRRVIVDITGTTIWNLDPWRHTPQATDLGTNLRTLADRSSVMARGVIDALRQAGVGPAEPVMLIGHSQGGMVAAEVAAEASASGEFTVSHLITAGSPIGLAVLPPSLSVLSLQNRGDLVPHLDGVDNPARPDWLTVTGDHGGPTVLDRHALTSYQQIATDVDRSADPSLRAWRESVAPFLSAGAVHTQVLEIRRDG